MIDSVLLALGRIRLPPITFICQCCSPSPREYGAPEPDESHLRKEGASPPDRRNSAETL